jgi:molybdenum cofactor cytidylyltransferase
VHRVVNPDPDRGMFSSIQTGLGAAAAAAGNPIVVLPADMPFVTPATVRRVADECVRVNQPVVVTRGGKRGHPLALPGRLVSQLLSASATDNLKDALATAGVESVLLEVNDGGVLRDVDEPADLA